ACSFPRELPTRRRRRAAALRGVRNRQPAGALPLQPGRAGARPRPPARGAGALDHGALAPAVPELRLRSAEHRPGAPGGGAGRAGRAVPVADGGRELPAAGAALPGVVARAGGDRGAARRGRSLPPGGVGGRRPQPARLGAELAFRRRGAVAQRPAARRRADRPDRGRPAPRRGLGRRGRHGGRARQDEPAGGRGAGPRARTPVDQRGRLRAPHRGERFAAAFAPAARHPPAAHRGAERAVSRPAAALVPRGV
ncbi:MAG: hypothetical protein AVDCRST_MAG08-3483, partial [uncultured Acetobacteraceae bacterium]